ncbi:50S ribosomal protein L30 [Candidatus Bathyarchaeota archaeon]|nr:50S ribosomal protein L30 [Candidatus Bathyarchaeota archaeon]
MDRKCFLVIRIRGGVDASTRVEDTLRMLRVDRNNTATLVDNRPEYLGMLRRAKDYITWGEPKPETIKQLLQKRGETLGGGRIEDALIKLGFKDLDEFAKALHECRIDLSRLDCVKPFFRLNPPTKGFKKSIKRSYSEGGELGYRGEAINELALKMI